MMTTLKYRKWKKIIKSSGLFCNKYYLFTYPDVRHKDFDPIMHYIKFGAKEGRNPSSNFDTNFYLENYQYVKKSNVNPLVYYILNHQKSRENIVINKVINEFNKNGLKSTINKSIGKFKEIKIGRAHV